MRKALILLCLLLVISQNAFPNKIDWGRLKLSWNQYLDNPSSQNANLLISILPDTPISVQGDIKTKDRIWSDLDFLEKRMMKGDVNAVRISFKLIGISDGGFTEEICIILGNTITIIPEAFLHSLKSSISLAEPVLSTILTYYDFRRFKTKEQEKKEGLARISTLGKVQEKSLDMLKSRCIEILKNDLKDL